MIEQNTLAFIALGVCALVMVLAFTYLITKMRE
jgi:hypothetical protein